jgi:hypothetical protein
MTAQMGRKMGFGLGLLRGLAMPRLVTDLADDHNNPLVPG